MRQKKRDEACSLLLEARHRSLERNALFEASTYSSIRGSFLVAMGRDEDAYRAHLDAEEESGGALQHRLTLARYLIYGMRQPAKALSKVEEVIASQPTSKAAMQETLAIRGLAQLALGQVEHAVTSLGEVFLGYQNSNLPAQAFDLTLVEELTRQGRPHKRIAKPSGNSSGDLLTGEEPPVSGVTDSVYNEHGEGEEFLMPICRAQGSRR